MNFTPIFLGLDTAIVSLYLLVLIFSVGIVWRVEKKLDLSYKFFVVAALNLLLAELLGFYYADQTSLVLLWVKLLRLLGVGFLLISILLMRDIVRRLDGEK